MNKLYVFLFTFLLLISTWAVAEEAELLDAYLEDLPSNTSSHQLDSSNFVGQPVDIVLDDNGQSHEIVRPQAVEYRRIETADGSELYQEVPVETVASGNVQLETQNVIIVPEGEVNSDVIVKNKAEAKNDQDLEIIELEPDEGNFAVIEADENQTKQRVASVNGNTVSGAAFCQQNPHARECYLSRYLSLCKKDPQSTDCKSQLQKFDNFCETFPNAYKCKKAKVAANCQKSPGSDVCKSFTQRYCQKYPKAIFCNYN